MSSVTFKREWLEQDIDMRMLYASEQVIAMKGNDKSNGLIYLSKVGLHLYTLGSSMRFSWDTFDLSTSPSYNFNIWHVALPDVRDPNSANLLMPLGWSSYRLTYGYQRMGGNLGSIFDAIANLTTQKDRKTFGELVAEAASKAPPLPNDASLHPLIVRFNYFTQYSAIGAAIRCADMILALRELQPIAQRGPGFFERGRLRSAGWTNTWNWPLIPEDVIADIGRQRAWMMIDSRRSEKYHYDVGSRREVRDPEVQLTYAISYLLKKKPDRVKSVARMQIATTNAPNNLRIQAGMVWLNAFDGQQQSTTDQIQKMLPLVAQDRISLMLLGYAAAQAKLHQMAVDILFQAAKLVSGYFAGSLIAEQLVLSAYAASNDGEQFFANFRQITQILPQQREPWQFLYFLGKQAKNEEIMNEAKAYLQAM